MSPKQYQPVLQHGPAGSYSFQWGKNKWAEIKEMVCTSLSLLRLILLINLLSREDTVREAVRLWQVSLWHLAHHLTPHREQQS